MSDTAPAPIGAFENAPPIKPWLKRNRPEMISKMRMTAARVPRATHADIEMIRAKTSETMTELFTRVFAAERARVTR